MHIHRRVALLGSAAIVTAGLSATVVAPASAVQVCHLEVQSLTTWNLQENNDDEIKLKLGSNWFGSWSFPDNWTRAASLTPRPRVDFTGSVDVAAYEVDAVTRSLIDSDPVTCTVGSFSTLFQGNGGNSGVLYEMHYRVT